MRTYFFLLVTVMVLTNCQSNSSQKVEIGETKFAEKTDRPADTSVHMIPTIDGASRETCDSGGSGHMRTIKVNGKCYSQMCCSGVWMYFYKVIDGKKFWCTCGTNGGWTVECDGNDYIIACDQ